MTDVSTTRAVVILRETTRIYTFFKDRLQGQAFIVMTLPDSIVNISSRPPPHQEPITWSVHLHCIRDPAYAQIELFLDVFPVNFCLHCGLYMSEINAEKSGDQNAKRSPASFARLTEPFSLSALISVICGPQRRQTFARNNSKNSSIWAQVVSQT